MRAYDACKIRSELFKLDYPNHSRFELNKASDAVELLDFLLNQLHNWNCSEAECRDYGCFSCSMFSIKKEPGLIACLTCGNSA